MELTEEELARLDQLPPDERAAELEAIELRLRGWLDESAEV
jgi:hypothetical protein